MIRRLRIRLVAVSMLSLFIVLTVIMGTMAVVSWQNLTDNADFTLSILEDNGGVFPKSEDFILEGRVPGKPDKIRQFSPELPYETRYFTVQLNEEGVILSANTGRIAAIDSETAMEFARTIWEKQSTRGFLGDYRYLVHANDQGYQIIFLDCGRSLDSYRNFMLTGIGVCFGGMLAVLFLLILLSGRIIKPVAESYEKQKRFITDAGHELKTPLTVIDADAEILSMDLGENEWLTDIQTQTRRLAELTNDLILLSRMEKDRAPVAMIEFPISDLAEEMVRSFQALARTQEKTFTSRIEPMLSYKGDEKSLRQLLSILLDNALKYSEPGGTISLELGRQGKNLHLSVYNTCPVMEREHLAHLFDRFYRTDSSRNSQTGGYGLGLSIAAAITAAHRGRISASTEDGHSLRITVTLPVN